jgi:hypothetical protein
MHERDENAKGERKKGKAIGMEYSSEKNIKYEEKVEQSVSKSKVAANKDNVSTPSERIH